MIEMSVDGDSLFAGTNKGYLIYDSLTNKSSFKPIHEINSDTDFLYDLNGEMIKVDEVNFYVSSDNELSFVELDVEDTDTYIINGSTAFNSLVTHNAPCFVEGTPILMEDGTYVNIENVKVGDRVLSFDFKNNESIGSNVLNIFSKKVSKVVKYKFESGKELVATEDHPIYVIGKGWTSYSDSLSNTLYSLEEPVKRIEVGDVIKLYNQTDVLVDTEILEGDYTVYNLSEVEKYHNYYANDVLSHNRAPIVSCFTYDTPVKMWDGSTKKIGEIVENDEVLSYKKGEYVKGIVTEHLIHPTDSFMGVVKYKEMISDRLHPYYNNGEWKPISEASGVTLDMMYIDNFYNLEIDGNLTFESEHNFIVEDFIVSGLGDNELLNRTFKRQAIFELL
jgi:intein/homing endonuclease